MLNNLKISLAAVLPMFLIMAAGYGAKLTGVLKASEVPRYNSVAFHVFMPFLLFHSIYTSDLSTAIRPRLMLFAVCGVLAVFGLSILFACAFERDRMCRGVLIQGIYRSNYVLVGLPIAEALVQPEELGTIAMLIAVVVPLFNVLAVVALETFCGRTVSVKRIIRSVAANPLIIGSVLGILFLALGLRLPGPVETAVAYMSDAATPLQLFLLGGFFDFSDLAACRRPLVAATVGRLVVVPALMLPLAGALGFRGAEFVALIGCFASSNAVSSFSMAQEMGGDARLAGNIVVLTSALCAVTVFGWTLLFKTLGYF